jgi:hypothetical protein
MRAIFVGHADAVDPRVCERAAHESHILQAGKTYVGHELAAAAHQPFVLLARQANADSLPSLLSRGKVAHDGGTS